MPKKYLFILISQGVKVSSRIRAPQLILKIQLHRPLEGVQLKSKKSPMCIEPIRVNSTCEKPTLEIVFVPKKYARGLPALQSSKGSRAPDSLYYYMQRTK